MTSATDYASDIQTYLTTEICKAMGLPPHGILRSLLEPIFALPLRHLAKLAADFEGQVAENGFRQAVRWVLPQLIQGLEVTGIENVPVEGPLVVASNHPGTYDSLAIAASLPRDDLKIIVGENPFFCSLTNARQAFIMAPPAESEGRMLVVRQAIHHLEDGGAVLIFPTGSIDPDPAYLQPEAPRSFERWSPSVELLLRKVPQAHLVTTIVSRIVASRYIQHPLTRLLRKGRWERQKMAEFMQVLQQLVFGRRVELIPQLTFGEPITFPELTDGASRAIQRIIEQAKKLLEVHNNMLFATRSPMNLLNHKNPYGQYF